MNLELKTSYDILKNIYINKSFSSIELNKHLSSLNVSNALVTKIVYGVLENDILLEHYIKQFYTKKPKENLVVLFKIGAYVSQFLNSIPNFALVNELVNLAKKTDKSLAGFANATLKNIVNGKIEIKANNEIEYLSIKHSYPKFLVEILVKDYSLEFVKELLNTNLTTLTHIRINPDVTTKNNFEEQLKQNEIYYQPSKINNAFYVNYEQLLKVQSLQKHYVVLGITSMNLIDYINLKDNANVFDACASPGGKSLYLAQKFKNANIIAGELYEHRVKLIENLIHKYNVKNITAIKNDATQFKEEFENKFDVVICDVPCSGIGVVSKKPDILLNRKKEDIKNLVKLQNDILNTCSKYVKPGGELYYSTCTILKQENQEVVYNFLKKNNNFELAKLFNQNNINCLNENNMLTFLPNISNTEGFFIAKLIKREEEPLKV